MSDEQKELRARLEQTQAELRERTEALRRERALTAELRDRTSELLGELDRLQQRLAEVVADRERVARLLVEGTVNPHQQGSAFSAKDVDALVAFLKHLK